MTSKILLYGKGETHSGGVKEKCYLECEIPINDKVMSSGFFPSVLHAYVMYAKDIGLTISDIICKDFIGSKGDERLKEQLVYSLWPLCYINNSAAFTDGKKHGVTLWRSNGDYLNYYTSIRLNTDLSYFYPDKYDDPPTEYPDTSVAVKADNRIPKPNNAVDVDHAWYLVLNVPTRDDVSPTSTYSIVRHYNELIVWNTLENVGATLKRDQNYSGLKEATGQVLKAVADRKYAYDTLLPAWNSDWGEKPRWYDAKMISMNNYNIAASLFTFNPDLDPDSPDVKLTLYATALNIKGAIKSGHAETRLVLTLDALSLFKHRPDDFAERRSFYQFYPELDLKKMSDAIEINCVALISSLKPCYMCAGEIDASAEGFIRRIDGKKIEMWNNFPSVPVDPKLKNIMYFDIDRPIGYYSDIRVTIKTDDAPDFTWNISESRWAEWSAAFEGQSNSFQQFVAPIGPQIVEPAGECLKTGYAYIRYLNSSRLLLTDTNQFIDSIKKLTMGKYFEIDND